MDHFKEFVRHFNAFLLMELPYLVVFVVVVAVLNWLDVDWVSEAVLLIMVYMAMGMFLVFKMFKFKPHYSVKPFDLRHALKNIVLVACFPIMVVLWIKIQLRKNKK